MDRLLAEKLYNDLVEDSILTHPLKDIWVEAIKINSWDDVSVTFLNGQTVPISGFNSPQHASKVIRHLLQKEGFENEDSSVNVIISNGNRITAFFPPSISEEYGVYCLIRKRLQRDFTIQAYISGDFAAQRELEFLSLCVQNRLSTLIVGLPGTGKTSFMNYLLSIANKKNAVALEQGFREIKAVQSILVQQNLVDSIVNVLDLTPELLGCNLKTCVSQEAILHGVPVIDSICSDTPKTGVQLAAEQWRSQKPSLGSSQAVEITCEVFSLVVTLRQYADGKRRISSITECSVDNGQICLAPIWQFEPTETQSDGSKTTIRGKHSQVSSCSTALIRRLELSGIDPEQIRYFKKEEEN